MPGSPLLLTWKTLHCLQRLSKGLYQLTSTDHGPVPDEYCKIETGCPY